MANIISQLVLRLLLYILCNSECSLGLGWDCLCGPNFPPEHLVWSCMKNMTGLDSCVPVRGTSWYRLGTEVPVDSTPKAIDFMHTIPSLWVEIACSKWDSLGSHFQSTVLLQVKILKQIQPQKNWKLTNFQSQLTSPVLIAVLLMEQKYAKDYDVLQLVTTVNMKTYLLDHWKWSLNS